MNDDAALRRLALEALGPFGDALAREALEHGGLWAEREGGWEGTSGHVAGIRAVLVVDAETHARIAAHPAAVDAVVAAVAAAIAHDPGCVLVDLALTAGAVRRGPAGSPYR